MPIPSSEWFQRWKWWLVGGILFLLAALLVVYWWRQGKPSSAPYPISPELVDYVNRAYQQQQQQQQQRLPARSSGGEESLALSGPGPGHRQHRREDDIEMMPRRPQNTARHATEFAEVEVTDLPYEQLPQGNNHPNRTYGAKDPISLEELRQQAVAASASGRGGGGGGGGATNDDDGDGDDAAGDEDGCSGNLEAVYGGVEDDPPPS